MATILTLTDSLIAKVTKRKNRFVRHANRAPHNIPYQRVAWDEGSTGNGKAASTRLQ